MYVYAYVHTHIYTHPRCPLCHVRTNALSFYTHIYIYTYTFIYANIHVYTHISTHRQLAHCAASAQTGRYTYTNIYIHTYIRLSTHIFTHSQRAHCAASAQTGRYTCIHIHIRTYLHTYTHTYTYVHIYINTPTSPHTASVPIVPRPHERDHAHFFLGPACCAAIAPAQLLARSGTPNMSKEAHMNMERDISTTANEPWYSKKYVRPSALL